MGYKRRNKVKKIFSLIVSSGFAITAFIGLINKIPNSVFQHTDKISATAAGFVMPDGAKVIIQDGYKTSIETKTSNSALDIKYLSDYDFLEDVEFNDETIPEIPPNMPNTILANNMDVENQIAAPNSTPAEGEETYSIIEKHFGADGITFENFSIKNTTDVNINIAEELSKKPDININKNAGPQVLIMHTHTCEAYIDKDQGFYPESFYPRSTDFNSSVVRVGEAIASELNRVGINTIHDTTMHDNPSYNGSYYRSEDTVKNYLAKYPEIQVVLDIHRDAIGNNESGKIKPTFSYNGKKGAQIMIIAGCDDDGTWDFPDWEYNLRFALRLQQTVESMYPGITRPLKFCPSQYNMHLTHGSLLVEVGTDVNTIDEASYSGTLLGTALADVITRSS